MLENDWILKQIEMLGIAFRRIVSALREGENDTALELCDEAVGEILDLDIGLIDSLDGPSLALLVASGTDGHRRALMLGEILCARVEAHIAAGDPADAQAERARAQSLLEAALGGIDPESETRARDMLEWLTTS